MATVTLTTDNGTFTADTIRDAARAERKALREKAKAEKLAESEREQAYAVARANGFTLCRNILEGNPRRSEYLVSGPCFPDSWLSETGSLCVRVNSPNGDAELRYCSPGVVRSAVIDGAGWLLAIIIDFPWNETVVAVVGAHGSQAAAIGIQIDPEVIRKAYQPDEA